MTEQELNIRIGNLEMELRRALDRFSSETGVIIDNIYSIERNVDNSIYYDVGVEYKI